MPQHRELAAGRWETFGFFEQMANIGSEIERTIRWSRKGNGEYARHAFFRALELMDLTVANVNNRGRLREIMRVREALADHFFFDNSYNTTDEQWRSYFLAFTYAARRGR